MIRKHINLRITKFEDLLGTKIAIVWNAHKTVFGSKRSAYCIQRPAVEIQTAFYYRNDFLR